jgi:polysaccharide biosynthesis/export protein
MWGKRMSCNPVNSLGGLGRQIVVALFVFLTASGWVHAQTESSTPLQTTPSAGATEAIPTDTASSTYRLQPYDLIDVDVYSEEDLHKPARLGSDGTVLLPLIGSVKVGGLTVTEATNLICQRYAAGFVKNPSVLITVLQYRKSTFSILGQVEKPGIYEISEGAQVSILEAVSLAAGFTPTAAQNSVTVKRMVDGKDTIFKVKAGDMAQNPDAAPFDVQPGDTILVPVAQYQKSNFSILGQVQKPGIYEIPVGGHTTIVDAISLAGGYTPMAAQNSVTVKRMVKGKLAILNVKANDMAQDPDVVPFEVLPGDIVLVQFRNSTFSILGQVEKPGIYEIQEGSHLNIIDAILMAGGYTRTAAQNSVTVKRTVNGKLTTIKVRAGDMAQEPDLVPFEVLPGDIVKVNESWY